MSCRHDGSARRARAAVGRQPARFAWLLVITGAAGLLAAWVITIDKFKLLEAKIAGTTFTPGCSLNPSSPAATSWRATRPPPSGSPTRCSAWSRYGIVICVGMSLLAGARFRRWYWLTFNAGTLFGVGFCTWLQYQSLYSINALCLWCSPGLGRHDLHVLVRDRRTTSAPDCSRPRRGLQELPGEFTWVLPVLHTGVIGMLILTRWWDFWTS